jgi:DVNP family
MDPVPYSFLSEIRNPTNQEELFADASGTDISGQLIKKGGAGRMATRTTRKLPRVGSKAQVFHGTAAHTSGGLTKKDLMKTKKGRIVSRKKHALGKKSLKNLVKAGYKAKKGTFKIFKK